MSHTRIASILLGLTAAVGSLNTIVQAATISVNIADSVDFPTSALGGSDLAGVVHVGNWNNVALSTTVPNLQDNTTANSGASITTQNLNGFFFGGYSSANGDTTMLNYGGYTTTGSSVDAIDVSSIPYAKYDVYIYSNQNSADERFGDFKIGATTIELGTVTPYSPVPPYEQATNASPAGNYVLFSGLTGSSFSLFVNSLVVDGSYPQIAISGLQIVDAVPEPTSCVLLGLGATGLLWVARRRAARERA